MARPFISEDRFSSRELAVAAELTPRNMSLLIEQGLAPPSAEGVGGRGSHRSYDGVGLGAIALLGAFHKAGMELLVAARLAGAMAEDYRLTKGRLPSNLGAYLQRPLNPTPGRQPWNRDLPQFDYDDDYWLHDRLRFHTSIYQPCTALRGDMVVEIVDQTYVLTHWHDMQIGVFSPVSKPMPASPEYRITGRGSEARIAPIHEGLKSFDFSTDHESADALRDQEAAYLRAHQNAVTRLRINVGLAVRNSLDRLADDRAGRRKAA